MFNVDECILGFSYAIRDGKTYLHSDGSIHQTGEYWPTREYAQKVLDKFYPKPKHEWKHGDVFDNKAESIMIYLTPLSGPEIRSINHPCTGDCDVAIQLNKAEFLFNIKEKLK